MGDLNMKKPSAEIMFLQEERPFIKRKKKKEKEEMTRLLQPSIVSTGRPMLVNCDYGKSQQ